MTQIKSKFELGRLFFTPNALDSLRNDDVVRTLSRHKRGDWGDVGPEDWQENEFAFLNGFGLVSRYRALDRRMFWVITNADRSSTTILLATAY